MEGDGVKKSKLARARTAMHVARHSENQVRANYQRVRQERGELLDLLNTLLLFADGDGEICNGPRVRQIVKQARGYIESIKGPRAG